jgi:hypothetical protein
MRGAVFPLPNTPSWRDAQLKKKHGDEFTFNLYAKHSGGLTVRNGSVFDTDRYHSLKNNKKILLYQPII